MYVIVRADLSPGLQLAQACHAAVKLCDEHGTSWLAEYPNLVVLQVPDEWTLSQLVDNLSEHFVVVEFTEPDLGGQVTAVAIAPDERVRDHVSTLPLAGKEPAVT